MFITSRILIVDMLCSRIPIEKITGFIINHAHKISDRSTEAFILRLYRQKNLTGFVKAFSDDPDRFSRGYVVYLIKQLEH